MALWVPIVVAVVTFAVYRYARYFYKYRGMPPYSRDGYLPVVGHLFNLIRMMRNVDMQKEIVRSMKAGPITTAWFPGMPVVVIQDFAVAKEMALTRGDEFVNRPFNKFHDYMPLARNSSGIIHTNGDVWRHNRRFTLTWMRNFGVGKGLMEQQINEQIDNMLLWLDSDIAIEASSERPAIIDFEMPLKFCISSIIAKIALGVSYHKGDQQFAELSSCLDQIFDLYGNPKVALLMVFPFLKDVPLFGYFGYDDIKKASKPLLQYYRSEIDRIKKEFRPGTEPSNLVEAFLVEIQDETLKHSNPWLNEEQLMGVIGDLWAAGMETTVNTCQWLLLYMLNFPETQEKVFREIQETCGLERRPKMIDQKTMIFVVAVINEVQRLANVVPNAVVHSPVLDSHLMGYKIPAGTPVGYSTMAVHNDPLVFPEPEKFQPTRFLEDDRKTLRKIEELIPFGIGKRVCPGESLAKMEVFLIFTTIMQRFKLEVVPGEDIPTLKHRFKGTLGTYPYKALVTKRF